MDILFLIDTTRSLRSHVNSARTQVTEILQVIDTILPNKRHTRIAIVAFRELIFGSKERCLDFLDFTDDVGRVHFWMNHLRTENDYGLEKLPEPLNQAISASWRQRSRCLIHIVDDESGSTLLETPSASQDDYYNPGSEPYGLSYQPLLRELVKMNINYTSLRIKDYYDCTMLTFAKIYRPATPKILSSNKFYKDFEDLVTSKQHGANTSRVASTAHFEEFPLSTNHSILKNYIVSRVISSFSKAASQLSQTVTDEAEPAIEQAVQVTTETTKSQSQSSAPTLSPVPENNDEKKSMPGRITTINWSDPAVATRGTYPMIMVHSQGSLQDIIDEGKDIKLVRPKVLLEHCLIPFAKGPARYASFARLEISKYRYILKEYHKEGPNTAKVIEEIHLRALCKELALEFSRIHSEHQLFDFVVSSYVRLGNDNWALLEPFIDDDLVKYNNNFGWVNQEDTIGMSALAQAFSHFTFERSRGELLMVDLQGAGGLLLDPAIHTKQPEIFKLSSTNLGDEGIKAFFTSHVCNEICHRLELKSSMAMLMGDEPWQFRDIWRARETTDCCSDKFCRRIIHLNWARRTESYPRHIWCEACWPQLAETESSRLCRAQKAHDHSFTISLFFYEATCQPVPTECTKHRRKSLENGRTLLR